jgi:hypothetical protein
VAATVVRRCRALHRNGRARPAATGVRLLHLGAVALLLGAATVTVGRGSNGGQGFRSTTPTKMTVYGYLGLSGEVLDEEVAGKLTGFWYIDDFLAEFGQRS